MNEFKEKSGKWMIALIIGLALFALLIYISGMLGWFGGSS